jgi:hypothetical protein
LGLEEASITLCQIKYCLDLLDVSGLINSKPFSISSDPNIKLHHDNSVPYQDIPAYMRIVGRLLYLNTTRPNITFITQLLRQFLRNPTQIDHNDDMRVLRYLKGSPRNSTLHIQGY